MKKITMLVLATSILVTLFTSTLLNANTGNIWMSDFINADDTYQLLDTNFEPVSDMETGESLEFTAEELDTFLKDELAKQQQGFVSYASVWTTYDSASYLTNNGYTVTVPFIKNVNTGEIGTCLTYDAIFPNIDEYEDSPHPLQDDNFRGILYYGFGGGDNHLQTKYGLSDSKALYGLGIASWKRAKEMGLPGNNHNGFNNLEGEQSIIDYINELKSKTLSSVHENFDISFDGTVSQTDPQKTNAMGINAPLSFEVTTNHVSVEVKDLNGNNKSNFGANEQFYIQAPPWLVGNVEVTVKTSQVVFSPLLYKAKDESKQAIGTLGFDDPFILNKSVNLNFLGAIGTGRFKKDTTNLSNVPFDHDLSKVKVKVTNDTGFNENFFLDEKGELEHDFIVGNYKVKEIEAPTSLTLDSRTFDMLIKANEITSIGFTDDTILSTVRIIKNNTNGDFVKGAKYSVFADKQEKMLLLKDVTTSQLGEVSQKIPYGYDTVYVRETYVPDYLFLDPDLKTVKLIPNQISTVFFVDVIKQFVQFKIPKTNEYGKGIHATFDIYNPFTNEIVDTIYTNQQYDAYSKILPYVNEQNVVIPYYAKERNQDVYVPLPPIYFDTSKLPTDNIIVQPVVNTFKRVKYVLPKIAETNNQKLTADGSTFEIINDKRQVIATGSTKNGIASFTDIVADKITKGMKYREKSAPNHLIVDATEYPIPDLNLSTYVSGTTIWLRPPTEPLINKLTVTEISKTDITGENELCGATLESIDKVTGKPVDKWTSCQNNEQVHIIKGQERGKTYTLKETIFPVGMKEQVNALDYTINSDGTPTKVSMKNELTKLTVIKEIEDNQAQADNEFGIMLIKKEQLPNYNYTITPTTSEVTRLFLEAIEGQEVITFTTTDRLEYLYEGIPQGYQIAVYEKKSVEGYELKNITSDSDIVIENKVALVTVTNEDKTIIFQNGKVAILVETGEQTQLVLFTGGLILLLGFAFITFRFYTTKDIAR